ncbi:MAG TPA: M64 family metallopeptidase [Bacteroidota bacterium]|nr:M64 family metallopeptidase [Bacteroidota bacterium]
MRNPALCLCTAALVLASNLTPVEAGQFEKFFSDRTLRVDVHHTGTKGTESFSLDQLYEEGPWGGSLVNLADTLNLGEYMARVYDRAGARLIFSRGFSSMFYEWQSTDEAGAGITRTFHESVRMPMPLDPVQFTICRRDKNMDFHEVFSAVIDPASPVAVHRGKINPPFPSSALVKKGDPHVKVDIVIVGDGYTAREMAKFRADAGHFNDVMFSTEPFRSRRDDFNVWMVEAASAESGIDKPDKNIWKNTPLGTMYNTFGSARYILTAENRHLRDILAGVPYDFILILVNDDRYGGGGIYNLYTTCYTKTDKPGMEWQMDYVCVHEFGHSFGGLGDEYYSSQVSFNDFYPKGIEPWEPNLTALVRGGKPKWADMVTPGTSIPTPWDKTIYDSLGRERAKLDRLADDYYQKREPIYQREMSILHNPDLAHVVGAFEGSGYVSEGIYRPSIDCRMFSLSLGDFDPVCARGIVRVIDFYSH